MNARLLLVRLHLPASIRRSILRELIAAMARAFEREMPPTMGLSSAELMSLAVESSRAWAEDAIREAPDLGRLERRLFYEAAGLGRQARVRLRINTEMDGMAAARVIYRAIGIDFRSRRSPEVLISRCAFARAYGPDVCRLMSSMDSGLIVGLTGALGMRFTQRLTDAAPACRAVILQPRGAS